jgi:hypothetical protein
LFFTFSVLSYERTNIKDEEEEEKEEEEKNAC